MLMALILAAAASAPTNQLRCEVRSGRVEITAPPVMDPRLTSVAVVRGKEWLVLVDDAHQLAHFTTGTRRMTLSIAYQAAIRYGPNGRTTRVRAFSERGTFRIVFSDNLETEPANMTMLDCLVRVR